MAGTSKIIEDAWNFYEQAKARGLKAVRWEQMPDILRAVMLSKLGYAVAGVELTALYTFIKNLEEEEKRRNLPPMELTEEEKQAMREVIRKVDELYQEGAERGGELGESEAGGQGGEANDIIKVAQEIGELLAVFDEKAIRPGPVAQVLMDHIHFKTLADTGDVLVYRDGKYHRNGEQIIKVVLQVAFTTAGRLYRLSSHFVNEVIEHIRRSTMVKRSEFDRDPYIINVRNGLLDLRTMELKPHDPSYLSVIQLPVEWNPAAQCHRWDAFIKEIVDEEDARVLQEFAGYTLWRDCRYQKALMLVGPGGNGKTTFLNILQKVLGRENLAFRSLHELTTNRFATADLYGKLANIYDDLDSTTLTNTGILKILVTGGEIQAERKFKPAFKFRNFAKLIFSANKVPSTYDDTRAFYRRWLIVNFPNEFTGDKADPHLEEKLSTPECLSYILRWAVEGMKRLLEQGRFSSDEDPNKLEDRWLRASNPAYAFIQDETEEDPEAATPKDKLYKAFLEYCRINKLPTLSKRAFNDQVKKWAGVTDGWAKIQGKSVRVWRGIRMKGQQQEQGKNDLEAWIK